jgi:hypothetical protein
MNERLQNLAREAGCFEFNKWDYFDINKFAELIVRECMKESMEEIVADEEIAQEKDPLIREYLTGNNQGIVDAVVRFRNHFGVTE